MTIRITAFTFFAFFSSFTVLASTAQAQVSVSTLVRTPANGGITVAENGDIIVAEYGNYTGAGGSRVFRFTPTGESTLLAQDIGFSNSGNDFDSSGNLIQASWNSGHITRITPAGDTTQIVLTPGPVGVVVDPQDNIFFTQCRNGNRIRRIPSTFVMNMDFAENFSDHPGFSCPNGLTMDESGTLYTVNWNDGKVFSIDQMGVATELADIPGSAGHLVYANNQLYVAGRTTNTIYAVDLQGNISTVAGTGAEGNTNGTTDVATFSRPNGIAVSNDGRYLYVSGTISATVNGGGSDNDIRVIDLGVQGNSNDPQAASLEGSNLSIPVLVFGGQYYTVEMTLNTNAEPAELTVSGFSQVLDANENGASTLTENILTIPSLIVGNTTYWAQFDLVSADSGTFSLIAADINDEDDDNDGVLDASDSKPYDANEN